MAAPAVLAIKIIADASKAQAGFKETEGAASKWSGGLAKASKVAMVGLAAVGGVMVAGVKAAAEDAQAQAILAQALKNSAGATDAQVAATEDWITKTSLATGVADDELRPALGALVRATGDVSKAQKGMSLALDIAAATGKDVQSVSEALAKAYAGNTTSLGKLVPGIDKATLASKDMNAITAELSQMVGGSAAASANTAAGQYQRFEVAIAETKEGIGAALLPVLGQLTGLMTQVSAWAAKNTNTITILLAAFSALAGIIVTVNAVTKAWTAIQAVVKAATVAWTIAQRALNLMLAANPIGLVIAAVALLVAGLIVAYRQSETFRRIVDAAFDAVVSSARAAFGWVRSNWPLLLAILTGPFGLAVVAIARNWDHIRDGAASVLSWFRGAWQSIQSAITSPFTAAWNTISGIIDKIRSAVSSVSSAIKSIPKPSIPHIPGLTYAPAPAVAGRAAGPRTATPAAATGGGPTIVIQGALDPEGVARQIRRILGGHDVRMGRAAFVGGAL